MLSCSEMPPDFHARYSCRGKEYVYEIWNEKTRDPFLRGRVLHYWYPLDLTRLNEAAACLVGRNDFTSFCAQDAREPGNMERTVERAFWGRENGMVSFTVAADGFLYHMVRIMVGTMLWVAQGKLEPREMIRILAARDRKAAGPTAPPQGLYLRKVFYEEGNSDGWGRSSF